MGDFAGRQVGETVGKRLVRDVKVDAPNVTNAAFIVSGGSSPKMEVMWRRNGERNKS